jgi:hypothetical protein
MDRDTARTVAIAAIKSTSMLTGVLQTLKERCDPAEYSEFRTAISAIAADISIEILRKILKPHPDLERELDEAIRGDKPLS